MNFLFQSSELSIRPVVIDHQKVVKREESIVKHTCRMKHLSHDLGIQRLVVIQVKTARVSIMLNKPLLYNVLVLFGTKGRIDDAGRSYQ